MMHDSRIQVILKSKILNLKSLGVIAVAAFLFSAQFADAACPDFAIEGFGRNATGGCGGVTIIVDTLNNVDDSSATTASGLLINKGTDGKISFKEAVRMNGARIVKFSVSGWIDLNLDEIGIYQSNITIDGSDAPNSGVGIRRGSVSILADNVIVRYMRFQAGELGTSNIHSLGIGQDNGFTASNVVIDHVTACWGDDGDLDVWSPVSDITIQWSLMCENMGPGSTLHSYGATRVTYSHNLYANGGSTRNPAISGGDVNIINNVIYRNANTFNDGNIHSYFEHVTGIGPYSNSGTVLPARVNFIGNTWKAGPAEAVNVEPQRHGAVYLNAISPYDGSTTGAGQSLIFLSDNRWLYNGGQTTADEVIFLQNDGGLPIAGSQINFGHTVNFTSANQAYTDVLAWVGAIKPCRDSMDRRVINDVNNGTGSLITDPSQVGGWPDLNQVCSGSPASLSGDINNDRIVNSLDWSLMSAKWLTADTNADLNHDGTVNTLDWSIMSSNWLKTS